MPSICYPVLRVPAVRLTKLDACGEVVDSTCSMATSNGIITIEQTAELEDRQDYFTLNADAQPCITDTSPPILKWINVTITFCQVDPELYNIATAEPLVLNDAASPVAVGFRTRQGSVNNSNFAFEAWTRIGGSNNCSDGEVQYGYFLLPWLVEGMVGDLTLENGAANFVITARTQPNSLWGVGPYNVVRSAITGVPGPLLVPIAAGDHRHMQVTTEPPPTVTCGCGDITPTVTVAPLAGADPLLVNLTVPTGTLPAYIDWDDGSPIESVTSGATVPHTYLAAGTYTVSYFSAAGSGPTYTSAPVVVT